MLGAASCTTSPAKRTWWCRTGSRHSPRWRGWRPRPSRITLPASGGTGSAAHRRVQREHIPRGTRGRPAHGGHGLRQGVVVGRRNAAGSGGETRPRAAVIALARSVVRESGGGGRGWVHGTERNGPGAWRRQNVQCARDRDGSPAGPRLGTEYDSPARRDRASALRRSGTASFLAEGWSECWATDEGQGSWGSRSGRRHARSVTCPTAKAPV